MQTRVHASRTPTILYVGVPDASLVHERKFSGIRRYASMREWEVVAKPMPEEGLGGIPELIRRLKPLGCIVECASRRNFIPKRLAGPIPVIYLDSQPGSRSGNLHCVSIDNEAVARAAMRELAGWRPASVAVVEREIPSPWSSARAKAFRAIAAATGVPCHIFAPRRGEAICSRISRLAEWLPKLPRPCGVFAVNDNTAAAVLRACRAAYLHIPKDIALVGVDDEAANNGPDRPLSSIQIDFEHAGFLAAKMLGEALANTNVANVKIMPMPIANAKQDWKLDLATGNISTMATLPRTFVSNHATVGPLLVMRRKTTSGRGRHKPCMEEALSIIRHEACDGLTARALAARFPGTRRLFDMRFREAVGHSVLDEILHVRMAKAFELLAHTDTPVAAVADFCGFGCYRALDRLFRLRCKMSMSEWRRRNTTVISGRT